MLERKIEARQLASIMTMFLIVQFGGLLIAIAAIGSPAAQVVASQGTAQGTIETALLYLLYILAFAALVLFVFRFLNGRIVFMLLEAFVVLLATSMLLFIAFSVLLPNASEYYLAAAAVAITVAMIAAKYRTSRLRNVLAITSSMGVGILIGLNGFALAYLFMLFIAVYDYIAVFVTKHMQVIAKHASSMNLALLVGSSEVEAIPTKYLKQKDIREFRRDVRKQKISDPVIRRLISEGIVPVVSQVQLGSGDLAIPLMVAVSAYATFLSYFAGFMVVLGAACGMLYTMYLLKKYKVALPAIPPLAAFISLFLGVMFLITDFAQTRLWAGFMLLSVVIVVVLTSKLKGMQAQAAQPAAARHTKGL